MIRGTLRRMLRLLTAVLLVFPIALGTAGALWESDPAVAVALTWLAHIGVDRLLGYGLKYPTAFKDTHFQRV